MTLNNRTNRMNCSCDRITVIIYLKEVTECLCLYVSSPHLIRTHQPVFVWAVFCDMSLLQFSFCSAFNWNPVDTSHMTVLLAHPIVQPSTVNFLTFYFVCDLEPDIFPHYHSATLVPTHLCFLHPPGLICSLCLLLHLSTVVL